ncbi:hypothetical protein ACNRBS_01195, partial [Ralstonia pseudosolanacearum]
TTLGIKPRFGDVLNGFERTSIIASYAYGRRLEVWLALDDAVYGARTFGREPGELLEHFLLLDSARGLGDEGAQSVVREWLAKLPKNAGSSLR